MNNFGAVFEQDLNQFLNIFWTILNQFCSKINWKIYIHIWYWARRIEIHTNHHHCHDHHYHDYGYNHNQNRKIATTILGLESRGLEALRPPISDLEQVYGDRRPFFVNNFGTVFEQDLNQFLNTLWTILNQCFSKIN